MRLGPSSTTSTRLIHRNIDAFPDQVRQWATQRRDVIAVALVGSWAMRTATPASDVDLVIIVNDPQRSLANNQWLQHFGEVLRTSDEDWGEVQSKRVFYANGLEVEFGITSRKWASTAPVDPGTKKVVEHGVRILLDRNGILDSLLRAVDHERK